ncbi:hypothetical protein GCM10023066_12690 [Nocardioides kongjuensis]
MSRTREAAWVVDEMRDFGAIVRNLVPADRYAGFARVLHRPDQGLPEPGDPTSWSAVARLRGTTVHPQAEFNMVARLRPGAPCDFSQPLLGTLDPITLPLVRDVVLRHTQTGDQGWFALWTGHGRRPASWHQMPTFHLPGRDYWLFEGAVAAVADLSSDFENLGREEAAEAGNLTLTSLTDGPARVSAAEQVQFANRMRSAGLVQSPNLWWPEDRRWFVASDIDLDSTIVAGPLELMDDLLAEPQLEVVLVDEDTSLTNGCDQRNRTRRPDSDAE